jgi:gliding motility-associated-like protein
VQTFEFFRVYNRYGQLVFETRTPGKGWDGNFNGIQQPGGAFVYQCKAVDYLGNTLFKKGSFVLIR